MTRSTPSTAVRAADRPATAYVMVTPALVRKLGAVRALVWARIDWRVDGSSFAAVDPLSNGERWWTADLDRIAAETGLSRDQVKRAVIDLERSGHLESAQFDKFSRLKSYRTVVIDEGGPDGGGTLPNPVADPSGASALSNGAESPAPDGALSPAPPISKTGRLKYKTVNPTDAVGEAPRSRSNASPATQAQLRYLRDVYILAGDDPATADRSIAELRPLTGGDIDALLHERWYQTETNIAYGRGHFSDEQLASLSPRAHRLLDERNERYRQSAQLRQADVDGVFASMFGVTQ